VRSTMKLTRVRKVRLLTTMFVTALVCLAQPALPEGVDAAEDESRLTCQIIPVANVSAGGAKTGVMCDYRHEPTFEPAQLTLEVAGEKVKLDRSNIKKYPAEGQKTALLAMFDVSDPRRNATTTRLYPKIVGALAEGRPGHLVLGVATFAQSLDIAFPLQPLSTASLLDNIPFAAIGAATELNRAALSALTKLEDEKADRKLLLVVSDGKAEDTAYKLADVVAKARVLGIPIVTVGIAERPSETPPLQSLRLLAEQSGGVFFDISSKEVPVDFRSRLLALVEVGGRVSFDGTAFYGKQPVAISLSDAGKRTIKAQTGFEFPDKRGKQQKIKGFFTAYWWMIVAGAFALAAMVWGALRYRRVRLERQLQNRVVAEFRGLDGSETRYEVRKAAVTLGRGAQNDIVITNSSVSGRHAELHRTREGGFRLSDLGSTNGTLVNGARITAADLKDGDLVEIAEVRLQFKLLD
jgi:hypothetical protein